MDRKRIIIAGPCAAESDEQISIALSEVQKRSVDFMRVNLWKPRTKPGFEGLGEKGLPLLVKVAKAGVNPGLEVIMPSQVGLVMDAVLPHMAKDGKLLLWIGARNQNHTLQKEIAQACMKDPRVMLMVKNQPWPSEPHWEGILEHILETGFPKANLLNCHRGFSPTGDNPLGLRNMPNYEMTARVKERTGVPVIFDPSHMGGTVANVYEVCKSVAGQIFDGIMVEVHHDPVHALTDSKQQVTWEQFDELLNLIYQVA
jgi:3-deoxy-D-arabino-heptulosonate 7-phosphate (DAHP) synthase